MTTKTDFHAIQELREKYAPKVRGIVSGEEAKTICEVLEIDKRNNIELQNIRDMVVMIYASGLINHVTSIWRIRRRACRRLISLRSIWTQ